MRLTAFLTLLTLFIFIAMVSLPETTMAQESHPDYISLSAQLQGLNKVDPRFNTRFTDISETTNGNIIDQHSKVIGEVKDILITSNGAVTNVVAEFDRLRLRREVPLDIRKMGLRPTNDGFTVGYTADQVEEMYPALLADIEPAAGNGFANNAYSARNLKGTQIRTPRGRTIARVNDVFFTAQGGRAEALYVTIQSGPQRGQEIAIPFSAVQIEGSGRSKKITISDARAEALRDFVRAN